MKKILVIAVVALLGMYTPSFAQSKVEKAEHGVEKGAKKAWHGTKKGATKAGNKTAEVASKGKATVTDKKAEQWTGPEGQTIYIDNDKKYYWINGKGKKIYVSEAALKAKQ